MRTPFIYILPMVCLAAFSCKKEDWNAIKAKSAPEFNGTIETELEVNLGLSAKWAAYNVGAKTPSGYGNYYSWGEAATKNSYCDTTFIYYKNGVYLLEPGQTIPDGGDAAYAELGYGWQVPSPEDWKELAENCSFTLASYGGTIGYVATSRVQGFEGKSIFFPCSGYRAASNVNNVNYSAIYWSNTIISTDNTKAINAFFTEVTDTSAAVHGIRGDLKLNMPPIGQGGVLWCGYPVRGVRKFFMDWDGVDTVVDRNTTTVEINVTGNSKWSVSADNGAVCTPSSGIGKGKIAVSFPMNETYNENIYVVTLSSPEFTESKSFQIKQFGIIPDFYLTNGPADLIAWDETNVTFDLVASDMVSWSACVKDIEGNAVEGASVIPATGTGSSTLSVVLPTSSNISETTSYTIELVTDNQKIPEEFRTITSIVNQALCPYAPWGIKWGNSFLKEWKTAGFTANVEYTGQNLYVKATKQLSNAGTSTGYIQGKFELWFTVANTGKGEFNANVVVGATDHTLTLSLEREGATIDSENFQFSSNSKDFPVTKQFDAKAGDIVRLKYNNGTSYARLHCSDSKPISWSKVE